MKKAARRKWRGLAIVETTRYSMWIPDRRADELGEECRDGALACLCTYCRYASFGDCWFECDHPLDAVKEMAADRMYSPDEDCWGFAPRKCERAGIATCRPKELELVLEDYQRRQEAARAN